MAAQCIVAASRKPTMEIPGQTLRQRQRTQGCPYGGIQLDRRNFIRNSLASLAGAYELFGNVRQSVAATIPGATVSPPQEQRRPYSAMHSSPPV